MVLLDPWETVPVEAGRSCSEGRSAHVTWEHTTGRCWSGSCDDVGTPRLCVSLCCFSRVCSFVHWFILSSMKYIVNAKDIQSILPCFNLVDAYCRFVK